MEAIFNFKKDDSLPLYFNLANTAYIENSWNDLNLDVSFSFDKLSKTDINLYLDSFDESG